MLFEIFDIQLFADADVTSGAAPSEGAGGQAAADTGMTAPAMQSTADGTDTGTPADTRMPWEQVREMYSTEIEADSKEYARRYAKDVVSRKLSKNKAAMEDFDAMKPHLDRLLYKHGLNPGDYKSLAKKLEGDRSVFSERAIANGTTEEVEEALFNAVNDKNKAEEKLVQREEAEVEERRLSEVRKQYLIVENDVRSIRSEFDPSFDLKKEMRENPQFARYAKEPHFTILEAYKLAHHDDIVKAAAAKASEDAVMMTTNAVRSGTFPEESAVGSSNAPANTVKDPSKLNIDEINQMIAEAKRGVKHSFS